MLCNITSYGKTGRGQIKTWSFYQCWVVTRHEVIHPSKNSVKYVSRFNLNLSILLFFLSRFTSLKNDSSFECFLIHGVSRRCKVSLSSKSEQWTCMICYPQLNLITDIHEKCTKTDNIHVHGRHRVSSQTPDSTTKIATCYFSLDTILSETHAYIFFFRMA